MTLQVYHLHEHELQAKSRVKKWMSIDAHQCNTPAALSRAYLDEPVRMPSPDQLRMRKHQMKITDKNFIRGIATWRKNTLAILQF